MAVCVRASASKAAVRASAPKAPKASVQRFAQGFAVAGASLALAFSAHADATVKLGADSGAYACELRAAILRRTGPH